MKLHVTYSLLIAIPLYSSYIHGTYRPAHHSVAKAVYDQDGYTFGRKSIRLFMETITHVSKGTFFEKMDSLIAEWTQLYNLRFIDSGRSAQRQFNKGLWKAWAEMPIQKFIDENRFTKGQKELIREFYAYLINFSKEVYSSSRDIFDWEVYYKAHAKERKAFVDRLEHMLQKEMPFLCRLIVNPHASEECILVVEQEIHTYKKKSCAERVLRFFENIIID